MESKPTKKGCYGYMDAIYTNECENCKLKNKCLAETHKKYEKLLREYRAEYGDM